mmetsp:Transcript_3243/g.7729  ORF Transcript_3243/g.7729 Transcript_3243/m.7729 type:complete len:309 (+) Transcript_3243:1050-1976(+)
MWASAGSGPGLQEVHADGDLHRSHPQSHQPALLRRQQGREAAGPFLHGRGVLHLREGLHPGCDCQRPEGSLQAVHGHRRVHRCSQVPCSHLRGCTCGPACQGPGRLCEGFERCDSVPCCGALQVQPGVFFRCHAQVRHRQHCLRPAVHRARHVPSIFGSLPASGLRHAAGRGQRPVPQGPVDLLSEGGLRVRHRLQRQRQGRWSQDHHVDLRSAGYFRERGWCGALRRAQDVPARGVWHTAASGERLGAASSRRVRGFRIPGGDDLEGAARVLHDHLRRPAQAGVRSLPGVLPGRWHLLPDPADGEHQ